MITELIITDTAKDELANLSAEELVDYIELAKANTVEAITEMAEAAREGLAIKTTPMFRSHWHCTIEVDIPEGEMPQGCYAHMRRAVEKAAQALHPMAEVGRVYSGWGLNRKGVRALHNASCASENCISNEDAKRRDG